jgi:superfamily II DNA or RNA helicase
MSGEWLLMSEVYAMFPVTSRARRHTLIFRPSNWAIYNPDVRVNYAMYLNLLTGEYSEFAPEGLCCYKAEFEWQGKKVFLGVCDEVSCRDLDAFVDVEVKKETSWFTPSIFKSLMQKCIRVRPIRVEGDSVYPVENVLISSFILLLLHPGAFVPNLNAFVNGAESALKRLGVSLIEDGVCSLEAASCLFAAALATRFGYFPSLKFVERCVSWCVVGLGPEYMMYNTKVFNKALLSEPAKRCCAFLEALGSFESDINMLYSAFGVKKNLPSLHSRPEVMPIYHCLDHHSICEIAHLHMEFEKAEPSLIFSRIWTKGTGLNSRKVAFEVDSHVKKAQEWLWILKTNEKERLELKEGEVFGGRFSIDRSWIAGLIGPMPLKFGSQELLSFYDPENIDKVISIRRPSRDSDVFLDEDTKTRAAGRAIYSHSTTPIVIRSPILKLNFECFYQHGDFACRNVDTGDSFMWNSYCESSFELPVLKDYVAPAVDDFEGIVRRASSFVLDQEGVKEGALALIEAVVKSVNKDVLMRLGMYLRPVKTEIMLNKLSRDGKGAYLMAAPEDSCVFRILLYICCLVPGVLRFESSTIRFKVKYFPFWSLIRSMVLGLIEAAPQHVWTVIPRNSRVLTDSQLGAVDTILDRLSAGRRGHLLWMDVGLGKTQIVLSIMESLVKENKMPRYCVFAITPSSEENICNQIKLMGLKVHKLDPRKGKHVPVVNCKDNCVNVVFHDHLDDLHENLKEISSEAFFLFDEVHYMFGNSKRSSVALELAKVCNMFIAMTGTLVRNKDIQKDHIIDWLGQVVDFEITSENYMIGVASLVSGKKELPIKQTRIEVDVPILDASYYNYVDSRFGGQSNKVDYFRAASICFESVYEGIKNRVLYHRELNHGCIFVVVKDKAMQRRLHDDLTALRFKCFSVGSGNSISIQTDSNPEGYEVVITTPKLETGYDVTAARYMITAPYPSNEASRTQLVGRIVRLSQKSSEVYVETLHCGILSYSMKHHEVAREISKSLSGMQKEV